MGGRKRKEKGGNAREEEEARGGVGGKIVFLRPKNEEKLEIQAHAKHAPKMRLMYKFFNITKTFVIIFFIETKMLITHIMGVISNFPFFFLSKQICIKTI